VFAYGWRVIILFIAFVAALLPLHLSSQELQGCREIKPPSVFRGYGTGIEFKITSNITACIALTKVVRYEYVLWHSKTIVIEHKESVMWYNVRYVF